MLGCVLAGALGATRALAQSGTPELGVLVDRVAVRFTAPETGGAATPRFIFERELAFEARLEALADVSFQAATSRGTTTFDAEHLRTALERHIGEELLASLTIEPEPSPAEVEAEVERARTALVQSIGGLSALSEAEARERMGPRDLTRLLARRARTSLYLDRMLHAVHEPTDAELRAVLLSGEAPFRGEALTNIRADLSRWYQARRLRASALRAYESARPRLEADWLLSAQP